MLYPVGYKYNFWANIQVLDRDLAELYGVETKRLKEAVKPSLFRFPEDFMFELTKESLKIGGRNLRPPIPTGWD